MRVWGPQVKLAHSVRFGTACKYTRLILKGHVTKACQCYMQATAKPISSGVWGLKHVWPIMLSNHINDTLQGLMCKAEHVTSEARNSPMAWVQAWHATTPSRARNPTRHWRHWMWPSCQSCTIDSLATMQHHTNSA